MGLNERHIRNAFIYVAPRFAGYGLTLLTLPVLTRLLAPEDFGAVTMTMLFSTVAAPVLTLGVTSAAQRYYFEYKANGTGVDGLMATTQLFLYLTLLASSAAVYFLSDKIASALIGDASYGWAVFVMYVAGYLGQIIAFYQHMLQNMEEASSHAAATVAKSVVMAALSVALVYYLSSYMGIVYASLISSAAVALGLLVVFCRRFRPVIRWRVLIENVAYGVQVVPKSFTGFINMYFDKYMLNVMLSLAAVGVYNIGQNVGNVVFVLMGSIWASFQPVYFKDIFENGAEASARAGRIFTVFSYVSLAPLLCLVLFAAEIMFVVAPPSYYDAVDVMVVIGAGIATQTFGMYTAVQYAYSKKPYWTLAVTVVGALVNVGSNIVLIPAFGLMGAAASIAISTTVTNALFMGVGQFLYRIEYEKGILLAFFGIVWAAAALVLYLRSSGAGYPTLIMAKLAVVGAYIYAGARAGIMTRRSVARVSASIFNFQKG